MANSTRECIDVDVEVDIEVDIEVEVVENIKNETGKLSNIRLALTSSHQYNGHSAQEKNIF